MHLKQMLYSTQPAPKSDDLVVYEGPLSKAVLNLKVLSRDLIVLLYLRHCYNAYFQIPELGFK